LRDAQTLSDEQILPEARAAPVVRMQSGGRANVQKAAEVAIHDGRADALGPVTLETPAESAHVAGPRGAARGCAAPAQERRDRAETG
jgi:ribosome biogenesis GTPase A